MTKTLSQRTLVATARALRAHGTGTHELEEPADVGELLYENNLPHWFVTHSRGQYGFDWMQIVTDVRNTRFFFPHNYFGPPGANITDEPYLHEREAAKLGEILLQHLAALATTLP
jgi:hypothetical protein